MHVKGSFQEVDWFEHTQVKLAIALRVIVGKQAVKQESQSHSPLKLICFISSSGRSCPGLKEKNQSLSSGSAINNLVTESCGPWVLVFSFLHKEIGGRLWDSNSLPRHGL